MWESPELDAHLLLAESLAHPAKTCQIGFWRGPHGENFPDRLTLIKYAPRLDDYALDLSEND